MRVIAFTGKRGSGKSLAVEALENWGFTEIKFADPLKNMLRAMYRTCGLSGREIDRRLEGDLKEQPDPWLLGSTPRWAMQSLGTEWRDLIDTNIWSNMFIQRIRGSDFGTRFACSDYRFPHEAKILDEVGALKVRIVREVADSADDTAAKHASETSIDNLPADIEIRNEGTIAEYMDTVRDTLRPYIF